MSRCIYNGQRLIPCPFVTITKTFERSEDTTKLGTLWQGTINGTIVTHKGSPDSSGNFWTLGGYPADEAVGDLSKLGVIFRKQEAIRELFSEDGHMLEFQSADATPPMKCNPRITNITFQEGPWYNTCIYNISFEADIIYVNGTVLGEDNYDYFINSASEEWQLETNEDQVEDIGLRTYRLTHNIRVQGKKIYNDDGTISMEAWERGRDWALPRLGMNTAFINSSGVRDMPSYYGGYNHVRNETIGIMDGTYSVTENWILASGGAIEEFDISTRTSVENSLTSVTIDGRITGLETRDADMQLITSKYANASSKFSAISPSIITRASSYSGKNLNVIPLNTTIGRNPNNGTISYSYEYNDRPSNLISGALTESITIQDSKGIDVIAIIPIPFRAQGPILQDIGTKREKTRTLTVEAVMPVPSGTILQRYNAQPSGAVEDIANQIKPTGYQVFQTENTPSWDIQTGRYSFTRQWTYED